MRIILSLALLFLAIPVWAMSNLPSAAVASPIMGKAAPDLVLGKSDGSTASVMSAGKGKKTILIFWATWCPNCYEEIGTINNSLASIEQKGIKIILVDIGETTEAVKTYFNKRQMKLISFVDEDSAMQEPYHLVGIPTLIFIDEKGVVVNVTHQFPQDYVNYFSRP